MVLTKVQLSCITIAASIYVTSQLQVVTISCSITFISLVLRTPSGYYNTQFPDWSRICVQLQ